MSGISTSSLSTRCSTSTPTSASRKSPTLFGLWKCKRLVKELSVGSAADALSSVATNTIPKMLNSTACKHQTKQRYAISFDAFGSISRSDYIFTYTSTSTELANRKASLIACCVESSAVVRGIDSNTLVIISRALRGGDIPHSILTAIYAPVGQFEVSSLTAQEKEGLET